MTVTPPPFPTHTHTPVLFCSSAHFMRSCPCLLIIPPLPSAWSVNHVTPLPVQIVRSLDMPVLHRVIFSIRRHHSHSLWLLYCIVAYWHAGICKQSHLFLFLNLFFLSFPSLVTHFSSSSRHCLYRELSSNTPPPTAYHTTKKQNDCCLDGKVKEEGHSISQPSIQGACMTSALGCRDACGSKGTTTSAQSPPHRCPMDRSAPKHWPLTLKTQPPAFCTARPGNNMAEEKRSKGNVIKTN